MFANYNFDNLPLVYVTFSENIDSENDFDTFLDAWLQLYMDGNDFSFVFDTRLTRDINIKYCIKMALFIKKLKKVDYHYLQKSLILVNNSSIKNLLDFIFTMQSPVAPVYVWETDEINNENIRLKCSEITPMNIGENTVFIEPRKSFIPFL